MGCSVRASGVGVLFLLAMTACAQRKLPREASSASASSSAIRDAGTGVPVASRADAELDAAPMLEPQWSASIDVRRIGPLVRVGSKLSVVALAPDGMAVQMLDGLTGAETWRVQADDGHPWSDVDVGRERVIASGSDDASGWANAFTLERGERAWDQSGLPTDVGWEFGNDGVHVLLEKDCSTRLVDTATGRVGGVVKGVRAWLRPFPPPRMRTREKDPYVREGVRTAAFQTCTKWPRIFAGKATLPIVSVFDEATDETRLVAMDPGAANPPRGGIVLDRWPLAVARSDDRGAVLWTDEGKELLVLALEFSPLRIAWKRTFPLEGDGSDTKASVRFAGMVLVAQAGETMMRIHPSTGVTLWTREIGNAVGALEGEVSDTDDGPVGHLPFHLPISASAVAWLDPKSGATTAQIAIPRGAKPIHLSRDGVLFVDEREHVLGFLGMDGALKWQRGPCIHDTTIVGHFVMAKRCGRDDGASVLVEQATGNVVGRLPKVESVLGLVPGEHAPSGLVVTTTNDVVAFSLPPRLPAAAVRGAP